MQWAASPAGPHHAPCPGSTLLAAVGHDLRAPLASIAVAAAGLRDEQSEPSLERERLLDAIEESVDSLDRIVTDLLDAGRLAWGAPRVRIAPVELVDVLDGPLRHLGRPVDLDIPVDLPAIAADRGLLERVIDNLLRNAVHHGGSLARVGLRARCEEGEVVVQVIDHGPGVHPADYARMFAPFERLDARVGFGVGMGLAVARAFTEAMGGRLVPSATPGGGLTQNVRMVLADVATAARR